MTRRTALLSLPLIWRATQLLAQAGEPRLTVRALNHMTLTVSDRRRSLAFYQGLFGWPVQHNQGTSTGLRIGEGPHYVSLSQGRPNAVPGIDHICWTIDGFEVDRVTSALTRHGVATSAAPQASAMKAWVRMRGPDAGGAPHGTPEYYVTDPDGIRFQLQDPRYCGGRGRFGESCERLPAGQGRLAVRDYRAFTLHVSDVSRTQQFYEGLFGMTVADRASATTSVRVGAATQRLRLERVGGDGERPRTVSATLTMDAFDPDRVRTALAAFGVTLVHRQGSDLAPLSAYVDARTARFADPDGIVIQLAAAT